MYRFIWFLGAISLGMHALIDAVQGPYASFQWVPDVAWAFIFGLIAICWFWMARKAIRGEFE